MARDGLPKRFFENALFRGDPDRFHFNACVGFNGGPYGFDSYAESFFEACVALVNAAKRGETTLDLSVYPIVFLFRHALELAVKHMWVAVHALDGLEATPMTGHDLRKIWDRVRPTIAARDLLDPAATLPHLDTIIRCIDEVDTDGTVFRYPCSKTEEMHLKELSLINIAVLGEHVERANEVFGFWLFAIGREYERRARHRAIFRRAPCGSARDPP